MATICPPRAPAKTDSQPLSLDVPTVSYTTPTRPHINDTHIKNRHCQELWEKEKRNAFPTEKPKTVVLLVSWEKDELTKSMDTSAELASLTKVLKTKYNYEVETKLLSTKNPQPPRYQLGDTFNKFLSIYDRPGNTLFIYYGGHGTDSEDGEDLILLSNPSGEINQSTALNWSDAEFALYRLSADLVLIFDCCKAGLVGRDRVAGRKRGPWPESRSHFQFIGSTPYDKTAQGPRSDGSFTKALIAAFDDLSREECFSPETLLQTARDKEDFEDIGQYPLITSCGKKNLRQLMVGPMPKPQAEPHTMLGPVSDESINFYLHLKYVFKEAPSPEHIRALAHRVEDVVKNDRLPIDDVLWEGLSEYNPRMSIHDAGHMLLARMGRGSWKSSLSAGRLEISASTDRPPAMLQRTLTTLTMDDNGRLATSKNPANDPEKNSSAVTEPSSSCSSCCASPTTAVMTMTTTTTTATKPHQTSNHITTLPFFSHPFCKPGKLFLLSTMLAITGSVLIWRFSQYPLLMWSWMFQQQRM